MRDDIQKMPISQTGKQYARLKGMSGLKKKQKLWYKLGDETFNKGRRSGSGFKSLDAVGPVKHSFAHQAESIVSQLLARR